MIVEEEVTLKRDLGAFGSFSIGYADVGADIYIALGLVLLLGFGALLRLALAVAAIGYACTAFSYAELAPAIPVAGGSSSFTREAFGDFYSFLAGWGLLLELHRICIAICAWFTIRVPQGWNRKKPRKRRLSNTRLALSCQFLKRAGRLYFPGDGDGCFHIILDSAEFDRD